MNTSELSPHQKVVADTLAEMFDRKQPFGIVIPGKVELTASPAKAIKGQEVGRALRGRTVATIIVDDAHFMPEETPNEHGPESEH